MNTLRDHAQSLSFGELIELFICDATMLGASSPFYFHNGQQNRIDDIHFQGITYTARPIQIEGFEYKMGAETPIARPHLMISNIGSIISALCRDFSDMIGAKVTRKRTYQTFITGGATPDPTQEMQPDVYYVDRKVFESQTQIEFELISPLDFENIQIPRRQVLAAACRWVYRGSDCGYAGKPVADAFGNPLVATVGKGALVGTTVYQEADYGYVLAPGTTIRRYFVCIEDGALGSEINDPTKWTADVCNKALNGGCKFRFGPGSPNTTLALATSAFPGAARLPRV